jgi:hypothetical protein
MGFTMHHCDLIVQHILTVDTVDEAGRSRGWREGNHEAVEAVERGDKQRGWQIRDRQHHTSLILAHAYV